MFFLLLAASVLRSASIVLRYFTLLLDTNIHEIEALLPPYIAKLKELREKMSLTVLLGNASAICDRHLGEKQFAPIGSGNLAIQWRRTASSFTFVSANESSCEDRLFLIKDCNS